MGDVGLVKEQLLIAFMHDLPAAVIEHIRAKFPTADITIIHLERMAPIPSGSSCTLSIDNGDADASPRICAEGHHYCDFYQSAEYRGLCQVSVHDGIPTQVALTDAN